MLTKNQVRPMFFSEQLVSNSYMSSKFARAKEQTKDYPLFAVQSGASTPDAVLISYEHYEKMYETMLRLADKVNELSSVNIGTDAVNLALDVLREPSTPNRADIIKKIK